MSELAADLLLHPIRLRIVQALVGRPMTATEVKGLLGDVAQATLYRHLKQLHEGGLLEVVNERQVRGGLERTYQVVTEAVSLDADDLAEAGADDHFRYFATFLGTLLTDYAGYLDRDSIDLEADRVGFRQVPLWLTDEEFDQLVEELGSAVERRLENEPGPGRQRRLITSIVMPDDRAGREET
ncbi:MAG: helix-turn-helix domain-containing protein [Acidimicrobiales bacterium]